MANCSSDLYCSFQANVEIKFYPGYQHLKSVMPVFLHREPGNFYHRDAVKVYINSDRGSSKALGHLEKHVASVIAPMMDNLFGFRYVA